LQILSELISKNYLQHFLIALDISKYFWQYCTHFNFFRSKVYEIKLFSRKQFNVPKWAFAILKTPLEYSPQTHHSKSNALSAWIFFKKLFYLQDILNNCGNYLAKSI
jgi:hypothetical protein